MQSHILKTFTTNFDPEEDRIRLDCSLVIDKQVQIYFTNRLSKLFITELVNQINKIADTKSLHNLVHDFSVSSRDKGSPVVIFPEDAEQWLTKSIDFVQLDDAVRIIFKDNEHNAVHLEGDELLLRNVLDIFYKIFKAARWDTNVFPNWADNKKTDNSSSLVVH